jgi:sugar lactone lactonase YvrE
MMIPIPSVLRSDIRDSKLSLLGKLAALLFVVGVAPVAKAQWSDTVGPTAGQATSEAKPQTIPGLTTEAVGQTSATQTATLTFVSAVTSGTAITTNVLTQGQPNVEFNFVSGGTCTTGKPYAAGATCTVLYNFTPKRPYTRHGAITLTTAAAGTVAVTFINGVGTGPEVIYPSTSTSFPIGYDALLGIYGVTVDTAGDVYFGDPDNGDIDGVVATDGVVNATSQVVTLDTTSADPVSIAMDGAGNIFYGDQNTGYVFELQAVGGVIQQTQPPVPLNAVFFDLRGLAVDGNDTVYVSDRYGVYELTAVNGMQTSTSPLTSLGNFDTDSQQGLALDGNGDLFISTSAGSVHEIVAVNGTISSTSTKETIHTGLGDISGIAVDGNGDVFIATQNTGIVSEILAVNGVVNSGSTVQTIASGFGDATGLAVDGSGNLYVSTLASGQALFGIQRAIAPTVNFPTSTLDGTTDTTDGTQTVELGNNGNAPLYFALPETGTNPGKPADFTFASGALGACPVLTTGNTTEATLVAGATCTIPLTFTPGSLAYGALTEYLTFTDNDLNNGNGTGTTGSPATATQSITLTGTARPILTSPTVTVEPVSITVGTSTTSLTASLAYRYLVAPTGAVTFKVGSGTTVTATCSGSVSPLTCVVSYPTGSLTAAAYTITSSLAADSNYLAASGTAQLTVFPAATITVAAVSSPYGSATATLKASIAFTGSQVPTGAVTFTVGAGAEVVATCTGSSSPLSCSVAYPTASLGIGSYTITATLAADKNYLETSNSGTLKVTAGKPVVSVRAASAPQGAAATLLNASVAYLGSAAPTGAVTFKVDTGSSVIATCTGTSSPLSCVASYPTGTLSLGPHTITASLAADANYLAASGVGTLTITGAPTVTGISPSSGPLSGGTSVTITGTNFTNGASVSFGGTAATGVTVMSSTSITAITPARSGTVDVTVTEAGVTSATNAADKFTYLAPTVTGLSPRVGPPSGRTSVTITGANFASGAEVSFGGTAALAVAVNSSTSITAITPAGSGTVDVTVTESGVTSVTSPADYFAYSLTVAVGSTSSVQTAIVTVTTAGRIGNIDVLTTGRPNLDYAFVSGGTCAIGTMYGANATCTVKYTLKPTAPGVRIGAVQLVASGGASVLGTAPITGTGTGPAVVFPTNQTVATLGSGFSNPYSMAVDAAGNVFVADFTNNAVKEIEAVNGTIPANPTIRTLGGGFNQPTGVAVDGAGNVYVADYGSGNLYVMVAVGGSIPTSNPQTLGLYNGNPLGVAVDGLGNIYFTDSQYGVLEMFPGSFNTTELSGTYSNPQGIAVDGFGNVFVADYGTNLVSEIDALGSNVATLGTFNQPSGVAVDAAGDVYVADGTSKAVYELVAVNGTIPTSNPTTLTLGTGFSNPTGVALDSAGDVYVADYGLNAIREVETATAPSLSFATTTVGSASSPQSFSLQNIGNQNLTLSVPASGNDPAITSGYTLNAASTCPVVSAGGSASAIAEGTPCTESISFMPVALGADPGSLTFTDNALNVSAATQVINLSGTGKGVPTVTAISPTSGPTTGGTNVTITGTNFLSGATVLFRTTAATGVIVVSPTSMTAVAPAGAAGTADVTVTTPGGTSATNTADRFTYVATPTVTSVFPSSGPIAGGTSVTISGTNFTGATAVKFGTFAATSFTVNSANSITAISTAEAAGTVDVTVTTAGGTSATGNADHFTYIGLTDTITFPALANTPLGAVAPVLNATSTSGQPVTYVAGPASVCTVAAAVLTDVAAGTCTVVASQAQSGQYLAATPVSQSYQVTAIPFVFVGGSGSVESFNSYGSVASKATSGGGTGAAVDATGYLWSIDSSGSGVSRFSPSAGALANDYTGLGLTSATALAIDGKGQVWITSASGAVTMLTNAGVPAATISDPSLSGTTSVAIDISGTVWVTNATNNTVDEIMGGAAPSAPLANAVQNNTPGTRP